LTTGWQATHLTVAWAAGTTLGTTGPVMLSAELVDPFSPAAGNLEYGYYCTANGYYVVWSNGTGRVNQVPAVTATGAVTFPAGSTAIFVSNGSPQISFKYRNHLVRCIWWLLKFLIKTSSSHLCLLSVRS
jgi:hypothetical protein